MVKETVVKVNKNLKLLIRKDEVLLIANEKHFGSTEDGNVALKLKMLTAKQLGVLLKGRVK